MFLAVIVLTGLLGTTVAQGSFHFIVNPKDTDVVEGKAVQINCQVQEKEHIVVTWQLNGVDIENTTRRHQEGQNLVITRALQGDSGLYQCVATNVNTGYNQASEKGRLNIIWISKNVDVELKNPRSKNDISRGSDVTLRCLVRGNPEPNIAWYKNSIRLFGGERINIRSSRLTLSNVRAKDNGIYHCTASNKAGSLDSINNFALTIPGDGVPLIKVLPQDVTVRKGDSTTIDCLYQNALLIEWYMRDEGPLKNTSRMYIYENGSLHFSRVKNADEGIYKCVALGTGSGQEQTYQAEIKIAEIRDLSEQSFEPVIMPNKVTVIPVNSKFEITCLDPGGFPEPALIWINPAGQKVSTSSRIRVDQENKLIIDNAREADSGNYSCVASNLAGETEYSLWLFVSVPPRITRSPVSKSIQEDESVNFDCGYSGSPKPITRIQWTHDGIPINLQDPRIKVQDIGTLTIDSVHSSDAGKYTCTVNTTGFDAVTSSTGILDVIETLKFRPIPVNKKLELGTSGKLHCKAYGSPAPTVKWIKLGDESSKWPSHVTDEGGTLIFKEVQHLDAGEYKCIATSSQGTIEKIITVDVIVAPRFKVKPSNTVAFMGEAVTMHCVAEGDPKPYIQWDKNANVSGFDLERFEILSNGSLHVKKVLLNDEGRYGCTAGNSGGFKREEVMLTVREEAESGVMTKTIIIAVGCAAGYMILVIGLIIWCKIRRAKQRKQVKADEGEVEGNQPNGAVPFPGGMELQSRSDGVLSDATSSHTSKSRASYDRLQFPRHDLATIGMLGKGNYGDVFLARARGIHDNEKETVVMVKSLLHKEEQAQLEFRRELDMYSKLCHPNVIMLLGICREREPMFMIFEHTDWGDLKQFLLASRKENLSKKKAPPLTLAQMISICHQVALGMEHLANHRFVHRDLAARNCLINSVYEVKVANMSLTRDIYIKEYYNLRQKLLPIRWMSPESLVDDDFSTKSDVWSFAVFMWEVFTQGDLPYSGRTDEDVTHELKTEHLQLPALEQCPEELHRLMRACWMEKPSERPSFSDLAVSIGEMHVASDL